MVIYRKGESGPSDSIEASFCICTLPLTILKTIPSDFAPRVKSAIEKVTYDSAYKVAWESRRFWEQDGDEIYGGISFLTTGPIGMVWYPSAKLMSRRGVLISGYGMENHDGFGQLPTYEAMLAASRVAVEKLHPGKSKELQKPIYMTWGRVPYSLGSWVNRGPDYPPSDEAACFNGSYRDSSFPMIGSTLPGTTAAILLAGRKGAALSAQQTITMIVGRLNQS
jgi:monoamine oxidase